MFAAPVFERHQRASSSSAGLMKPAQSNKSDHSQWKHRQRGSQARPVTLVAAETAGCDPVQRPPLCMDSFTWE